jgi:two-component system, OmpR family, response regulator
MPDPLRVLVVDDDEAQLSLVERSLRLDGFVVETTNEAFGVSNIVRRFQPNIVLLDVNIPALSGDRLLPVVRRYAPASTKLVLFSACGESELRKRAHDVSADGWISKSAAGSELARQLRKLCVLE